MIRCAVPLCLAIQACSLHGNGCFHACGCSPALVDAVPDLQASDWRLPSKLLCQGDAGDAGEDGIARKYIVLCKPWLCSTNVVLGNMLCKLCST